MRIALLLFVAVLQIDLWCAEGAKTVVFVECLNWPGPVENIQYLLDGNSIGVGDKGFLELIGQIHQMTPGTYLVNITKNPTGEFNSPFANHASLFDFIVKKSGINSETAHSKEEFFTYLRNNDADLAELTRADKIARDIAIGEYREMYNYGPNDERVMYQKKYIQQMLRLDDKKLTAYFAKDKINHGIAEYSWMLGKNLGYFSAPITPENIRDFKKSLETLKSQFDLLNKYYPSGKEIFEQMITDKW